MNAAERTEFGERLEGALKEVLAWKRAEISLPARIVDPFPAERVKAIRKTVAEALAASRSGA